jgi:hypothetical protein
MTGLCAGTVWLAALAVVLAHRPAAEVARLDRGHDRGVIRLRAIKPRNGDRRPAGHQTADTEGKAGWKFLPRLSNQKAEYRLRVDFGCGLVGAARPRRSAPGEHPECRAATCFDPRHCGFVLQRPWSGMGGHRDNPAGIRSRLDTGICVSIVAVVKSRLKSIQYRPPSSTASSARPGSLSTQDRHRPQPFSPCSHRNLPNPFLGGTAKASKRQRGRQIMLATSPWST